MADEHPIIKTYKYFLQKNMGIVIKGTMKKTITGFKEALSVDQLEDYLDNNLIKIMNSVSSISLNLTLSYPNAIVLDIDYPGSIYTPETFRISKDLENFFSFLKNNNCLIISSPTNSFVSRFKVIFKLTGDNLPKKYELFQKEIEPLLENLKANNSIDMNLESRASIVGISVGNLPLTPFFNLVYNNQQIPEIPFNTLKDILKLDDTTQFVNNNDTFLRKYLISARNNISPFYFFNVIKPYFNRPIKNNQQTLKDLLPVHNTTFVENLLEQYNQELQEKTIKYQDLIVKAFQEGEKHFIFFIYKPIDSIIEPIGPTLNINLQYNKDFKKPTFKFLNETEIQNIYKQELKEDLKQNVLRFNSTYNLKYNKFYLNPLTIKIISDIVKAANENDLEFALAKIEFIDGDEIEYPRVNISNYFLENDLEELSNKNIKLIKFTSYCKYLTDKNKLRDVELVFLENKLYIYCFHDSCKKAKRYKDLELSLKNAYITNLILKMPGPFKKTKLTTKQLLNLKIHNYNADFSEIANE